MNKQQYLKAIIAVLFSEICVYREVQCRRIQDSDEENLGTLDFYKLFEAISRTKESNLPSTLNKRKFGGDGEYDVQRLLSVASNSELLKQWLREDTNVAEPPEAPVKDELAGMIENELLNALSKKSSAVLDRPYLQKKGRNDFLVLRKEVHDPFVTIIPNDIYYNVEKKCINWLDDCNQRGLRNRLLQKVNSPF